jgi:hypothetical protein
MMCGLKVDIDVDFIEFGCCSGDWFKMADNNVHWWVL